jgi:hypothetical protein
VKLSLKKKTEEHYEYGGESGGGGGGVKGTSLSLSSRLISSHTTPRMQTTASQHHQEFRQVRLVFWLIVLSPLISGLMVSPYLAYIHITF